MLEAAGGASGFDDDRVGLEQVREALAELREGFGARGRLERLEGLCCSPSVPETKGKAAELTS